MARGIEKVLTARGKTQSILEWSKESGNRIATIFYRLYKGWSDEDAIFRPLEKRVNPEKYIRKLPMPKLYKAFGKEQVLSAWSMEYGITTGLLHKRMSERKFTIEEALTYKATRGCGFNPRYIDWNGVRKTITEWQTETGILSNTIKDRIDFLGWSVEKALTTPVKKTKQRKKPRL